MILRAECDALGRVLREVRVERGTAVDTLVIMRHDFFQRVHASVMHVGSGEGHIAQAGGGKLAAIRFATGRSFAPCVVFVRLETVIVKLVVAEKRSSVAVEAVRIDPCAGRAR